MIRFRIGQRWKSIPKEPSSEILYAEVEAVADDGLEGTVEVTNSEGELCSRDTMKVVQFQAHWHLLGDPK